MLKEAYRINKNSITAIAGFRNKHLRILFTLTPGSYNTYEELDFKTVSVDMLNLVQIIENKLTK